MVLLLLACATPSDSAGGPLDGVDSGDQDTGDPTDTGDTEDQPIEIPAGPDCTDEAFPLTLPLNVVLGHVVLGQATEPELTELRRLVQEWVPSQPGPWAHAMTGPMRSTDGINFSAGAQVLHKVSVPEIAIAADGSFVALYVDGDLDRMLEMADAGETMPTGIVGLGGLGAATSPDGVHWTRASLTTDRPFPVFAVDPEVHELPGGGWALYFLGVPAEEACADAPDPFVVPGGHRLYRAESTDLLNWRLVGEVWTTEAGGVDPAIWCVDDATCYGWFGGTIGSDDGGLTWAVSSELSLPMTPQIPDVVQFTDDTWRMYYGTLNGTEVASSADGLNWQVLGVTTSEPGSPTVVLAGDTLWMWSAQNAP
ncbi:MAG: hypothetical protein EXR71_01810 [Myxococcales bacterium]|nr:hypothetical protein [Myxococcales bacterium]